MIRVSSIILILVKALVEILLLSMKSLENSGDVDADGVPLDDDYNKQSFLLASFRDIQKAFNDYENEQNC